MIEWYSDNKLGIFFDDEPKVGIRYILPSTPTEEKKSIKKYPFICRRALTVKLSDYENQKNYKFTIPKGYTFDGASVPKFFWRIIGAPTDNNFLIAALVHDVMCENHSYIDNDRAFSTKVFNALLTVSEVGKFKRFLMSNSVNIFQRFCGWGK